MDGRKVLPGQAVVYPVRDDTPMGETDDHRDELQDWAVNVLRDYFKDDPLVYVSGNNFIYFEEGSPQECVSPDTYVVKGVPSRQRDLYKVWEEGGRTPCFVLEITSKSTRRADRGEKMAKYRDDLHVQEYFLFDPHGEWLAEGLQGYALEAGVYQPIVRTTSGRLPSRTLGLELALIGGHLRFFPPGAALPLPTRAERAERARQQAARERLRAEEAEREVERLRAELKRLRGPGTEGRD